MMGFRRSIFPFIAVCVLSQVFGEVKLEGQVNYGKVDNVFIVLWFYNRFITMEYEYEVILHIYDL